MTAIARDNRHTKANRCPICDGADGDPRGKNRRCSGFTSSDGTYVHCSREELAGAIEQNGAGLFAHKMAGSCHCGVTHGADLRPAASAIEATYNYTDEGGQILFQVVRKTGKQFRQRKPDGAGGWEWKLGDVRRVLYNLPNLAANPGETVYIVEGERDADTLNAHGLLATTNPHGAGKWSAVANHAREILRDVSVRIIADADAPGRKHAREIAASLKGHARSVVLLEAPNPYKDVSALLADGGKLEALETIHDDDLPPVDVEKSEAANDATPVPFRIWTADEIWAPLPEVEYAIGGLVPRGSLALVVAFGSSLKTWMMVDLLIAKAAGLAWLERFPCESGEVLFWDWESGDHELRRRAQRASAARGIVGPVQGVAMVTMPDLFFNSKEFEGHVTALASSRSIIVFDSLAAGTVDVDENDARFAQGLQTLKRVAVSTGCAFVVLHHSRKQPPQGKDFDARESARGTGAIFAAADVVLQLAKADEGAMLVMQTKARGGKAIEPFTVRVDDIGENATRIYAGAPPEPQEDEVKAVSENFARAKAKIITLLGREHDVKSASEVFRRLGGKRGQVLEAVKELLERGLVVTFEGCLRLASEVR